MPDVGVREIRIGSYIRNFEMVGMKKCRSVAWKASQKPAPAPVKKAEKVEKPKAVKEVEPKAEDK